MKDQISQIKVKILDAAQRAGEGHLASSFSVLDILWVLYQNQLVSCNFDLRNPNESIFLLSKGHASLALYGILNHFGYVSDTDLSLFCSYDSKLGGHPDRTKLKNLVVASTGSLGHGLSIGVGLAMSARAMNSSGEGKIYCLIGDGEANEGSIWESLLLASHHKLDNLVIIIDDNESTVRALSLSNLEEKLLAFGCGVRTVDGHDHEKLKAALDSREEGKPLAIIARTIKGKGISSMEGNPEWHHKAPTSDDVELFVRELIK